MKQLMRPQLVVIGAVIAALLALGGAAAYANGGHVAGRAAVILAQSERSSEAAQNEDQDQDEAAEAAEDENEPVEDEDRQEDEVEDQAPPAPAPAPAPVVTTRTFQLVGGTATFSCTGNAIGLVSAAPNSGFGVETETEDGGAELRVRFENDAHRSEIRVGCSGGQVVVDRIREESR